MIIHNSVKNNMKGKICHMLRMNSIH